MPDSPYIYERQVEHWTSNEIEAFFENADFDIRLLPITQLTERHVPADFLFLDSQANKLFGLQYKTLYHNGDDYWNLDSRQHTELGRFDWIYYGLSELKSAKHRRNALHYLRLLRCKFDFTSKLSPRGLNQAGVPPNFRWAAFFEGLRDCKHGRRIFGRSELHDALWPNTDSPEPRELSEIVDEVFIANFQSQRAARFSSLNARQGRRRSRR